MEKIDIQHELQCIIQFRENHEGLLKSVLPKCQSSGCEEYWVVMIRELVDVAGYTYSRIAKRMNVSASTIQKLATQAGRKPRQNVFFLLMCLYYRVFHGPYRSPQIIHFTETQAYSILDQLPKALFSDFTLRK